jgi:hypothetical protein
MTIIATVATTGNPTYDRVLRGIYGTVVPGPHASQVIFTPAPEFAQVSHLFRQLPQLPVPAAGVKTREVPEQDADLAKAQILFGLGARWQSMYAPHTAVAEGGAQNLGQALLSGEANAVADGVRQHLSAVGMQVYEVPVTIKGEVHSHGSYVGDAASLINHMSAVDRAIALDDTRQPRALGTLALTGAAAAIELARATQVPAPGVPAAAAPTERMSAWLRNLLSGSRDPQAPAAEGAGGEQAAVAGPVAVASDTWANFQGVDATVRGLVYVVAPNINSIPRALGFMLEAYKEDAAGLHLEPVDVAEVRDLQRADLSMNDFEDSDFDADRQ